MRARTDTRASAPNVSAPLRARTGTRECPGPAPLRACGTRQPVPTAPLQVFTHGGHKGGPGPSSPKQTVCVRSVWACGSPQAWLLSSRWRWCAAPLRARTGLRECPSTQHKHCLPSRECPRRECPLARAHGHTRVPGPCTLARVRHAPASAHGTLASFYTRGSQRRPGAQQPETDGVRAQRLGLRFAASVAAVLALAVVRSSLARAHGLARVPQHTTQALPAVRMRCSLPPV